MNIVLAAAALLCAVGCLVLFTEVNEQRDRVRALEAQVAQLQQEMSATVTTSPAVTTSTAAQTSEPPAQAAATPAPQSSAPAVSKPATAANNEWRQVLADPAYRRARLTAVRLDLQRGYPQLVAELGLSSDEAERFIDLLAEQRLRESEQDMKERSSRDHAQWRKELYAQFDKERRALLGEERFRVWTEYLQSTQARAMVSDLRTQLAITSSPLREEQVKPLVKALATEHARHAAERRRISKPRTMEGLGGPRRRRLLNRSNTWKGAPL
jgi:polyhydroxyalkanoate synthesis regulator phasin